ncbi:MAG: tryptophan synthase subunit alpha [Nitrospirota bacterium]|nr:tryptophan synthase subunit alpha [Nitrospirota bacterium]
MSNIAKTFEKLKKQKNKALVPYIMAGDPELAITEALVPELAKAGADIIELGVPFSDPLADGPTIQRAAERALRHRVSLANVIAMVKRLRSGGCTVPIVLMTYYNPVLKYGEKRFVKDAVSAGVDGVIVPDLPPEEAGVLKQAAEKAGLDTIFLLAPTSTAERIALVGGVTSGFIYYVSLTGVTGARKALAEGLATSVKKIKKTTDKPVCVGFGVSTPEQAAEVAGFADGVIVGSALVNVIEQHVGKKGLVKEAATFVSVLKKAIS